MVRIKLLLIYAGGTIGMVKDPAKGTLTPLNFDDLIDEIPELKKFDIQIECSTVKTPKDSANTQLGDWIEIAGIIEKNYTNYNGFIILHGTDTMAYTASALSFMIEGLKKPIILTGSQLPIGSLRTDGKENVISAIEIAASTKADGAPVVQEVCIYFEDCLFRGNRTTKVSADYFEAFDSPNFPKLATVGVDINFNLPEKSFDNTSFGVSTKLDDNIVHLKIYPGMNQLATETLLKQGHIKALVLETYGTGNAPDNWLMGVLHTFIKSGKIVLNISQCANGKVDMTKYDSGQHLKDIGVLNGSNMTLEAALTKLMYLFGKYNDLEKIKSLCEQSIRGELS